MARNQYTNLFGRSFRTPWPSNRFLSLSPVRIANKAELKEKLQLLANSKKSKTGERRDRSKANTQYSLSGDQKTLIGASRATFEHQRVLIRILRNELGDPYLFSLQLSPWLPDIRVMSLAFNTWSADMRVLEERVRDPMILDASWTEFVLPSPTTDLSVMKARHIVLEENRLLSNRGSKRLAFVNGETETLNRATLVSQMQQLFALPLDARAAPVILLVHGDKETRGILNALGVDTSRWSSCIYDMLYGSNEPNHSSRRDVRSSRSQSPRARGSGGARPRSPSRPVNGYPPVYIVDVRNMYMTMKGRLARDDTVIANARDLCIEDAALADDTSQGGGPSSNGWCAGIESRLLGFMWYRMARGPAIDEQHKLRWNPKESLPTTSNTDPGSTSTADAPPEAATGADDSDFDPNDLPAAAPTRPTVVSTTQSSASRGDVYVMDPEGGTMTTTMSFDRCAE
ncbi:hypothetical protein CERSUDRAFT_64456 [Gelatoporia subvermispora B]|uniref:Uncharacterized protein n=1 Tax=Ceriporiopsis subvermispora (strain B) TaxID=914234 RepID=M2R0Z5_CERS8|nr:hypothetical protein CERSUDRAFT_64456 [Gelatoporia subvermispora B]